MDVDYPSVAICAIGQSGLYETTVNKWFQHHLDIGFDHAYVYIDDTMWDLPYKIEPELTETIAHVVMHPHVADFQQACYHDCYKEFRDEYDWMLFMDFGEYLVLNGEKSIKGALHDKGFLKYDAIRVNMENMPSDEAMISMNLNVDEGRQMQYLAKSFVNCSATGIKIGEFAPMRENGEISQCLPDMKPVTSTNSYFGNDHVDRIDTSVMYLTSNPFLIA